MRIFSLSRRWRLVARLTAGRVAAAIPIGLLVATLIFFSVALLPGDLATETLGREATPEVIANLRHQLGLDQPILKQYFDWLHSLARGDFGHSLASGREVVELVLPRLYNTLFLAGLAAAMAVPLSLALGVLSALWRHSLFDRLVGVITFTTISLPDFFVAYLVIFVFSVYYPIFPSISNIGPGEPLVERVWNTVLPALTLTLLVTGPMARMIRVTIVNTFSTPYIEMAHLKGTSPVGVILKHAMPNVIAPVATVIMLNLSSLIVGVVIVETVFAYPGLGQLLVDSVSKRDLPVVQACSLAFAATYIFINLFADVIGLISDPRRIHGQQA
jgi:peptide/nickel transport system permease protein